ncbi:MAG: hypothetical protein AAFY59_19145, partial [Pseudomonadota bacterium]
MFRILARSTLRSATALATVGCVVIVLYILLLVRLENAQHHLHISDWATQQSEHVHRIVGTAERLAYLPEGEAGDALARRISDELERLNTL